MSSSGSEPPIPPEDCEKQDASEQSENASRTLLPSKDIMTLHAEVTRSAVPVPNCATLPASIAHLSEYGVPMDVIRKGITRAEQLGMPVADVMIAEGMIGEITFYRSLSNLLGLEFDFLHQQIRIDEDGYNAIDAGVLSVISLNGERHFALAPTGATIEVAISVFSPAQRSSSTRAIVTVPSNFVNFVRNITSRETAEYTTKRLQRSHPEWSAVNISTRKAITAFSAVLFTTIIGGVLYPSIWHLSLLALTAFPILPALLLKVYLLVKQFRRPALPKPEPLSDKDLPIYTVLVPLYREADVVAQLVAAILAIDYPRSKLDVKILLEEDDKATIARVRDIATHRIFEIIICPVGQPRTKPRALDIGLFHARGECVVVYDAEDVPEPGQLKLAAAYFAASDRKLGCLQCRLAIENLSESWLARMFAFEYARLFDLTVPLLAASGIPIPLGGTSNHFRREVLEQLVGWDPWNVTEDADIGLRLARLGYSVEDLPSSTLEEAPFRLTQWFDQRTRWMKGWIQTALVHSRNPLKLAKKIGCWRATLVVLTATHSIVSALFHPLLLIVISLAVEASNNFRSDSYFGLWIMGPMIVLSGGICLAFQIEGARLRRIQLKWTDIPMFFIYSLLITGAAWRGLIEFAFAPSLWRKTPHGLTKISRTIFNNWRQK